MEKIDTDYKRRTEAKLFKMHKPRHSIFNLAFAKQTPYVSGSLVYAIATLTTKAFLFY